MAAGPESTVFFFSYDCALTGFTLRLTLWKDIEKGHRAQHQSEAASRPSLLIEYKIIKTK